MWNFWKPKGKKDETPIRGNSNFLWDGKGYIVSDAIDELSSYYGQPIEKDVAYSMLVARSNWNAIRELSTGTSSLWNKPYMGDTGSSLRENILTLDTPSFERCPYCNRKNPYNNCVCDGCGANL